MLHKRPEVVIGASVVVFGDREHWRLYEIGKRIAHGERWDRADALELIEAFRGFVLGIDGACIRKLYRKLLRTARWYYDDVVSEANKRPRLLYAVEMSECAEKTALWRAIQIERLWRMLSGSERIAMAELRHDLNIEHELAVIDVEDDYFGGKAAVEARRDLQEHEASIPVTAAWIAPVKPKRPIRKRKLAMAAETG